MSISLIKIGIPQLQIRAGLCAVGDDLIVFLSAECSRMNISMRYCTNPLPNMLFWTIGRISGSWCRIVTRIIDIKTQFLLQLFSH